MNNIEATRTNTSYGAGIGMLIAFAIGGFLIAALLAMQVWSVTSGIGYDKLLPALQDPKYMLQAQLIQMFSMLVGFLAATVFAASRLNRRPLALMGFTGSITAKQVLLVIGILFCAMQAGSALGYLSYQLPLPTGVKSSFDSMEAEYMKQATGLISMQTVPQFILSLVVIALVPAICEEAFFRGGLQNFIYRSSKNMWVAVIVTSIIFSAVHFSGYGFLTRLLLAVALGLIYHYSGRLWLSILAHFLNNAAALAQLYFLKADGKKIAELMSDKSGSYLGLLALPAMIYLLLLLRKTSVQKITLTNGI